MPSKHAAVGGSTIERVMACPGSLNAAAAVPRSEGGPAARRGTALHHAVGLVHAGTHTPEDLVGLEHEGHTIDALDARAVLVAHSALKRFIGPAKKVALEVEVTYPVLDDVWGTADVLGHYRELGLLGDFKFGTHRVAVKDNKQLMFYAAAALAEKRWPKRVTHVTLAIIQPPARPVLDTHVVTVNRLHAFREEVAHAVSLARKKDAPFKPGEHCKWCPAKPVCPALVVKGPQSLVDALAGLQYRV